MCWQHAEFIISQSSHFNMSREEKTALLRPTPVSPIYPPFVQSQGYPQPLPPYNVTHTKRLLYGPNFFENHKQQPRRITSVPVMGVVAIALAIVLLLGVSFISHTHHKEINSKFPLRQSPATGRNYSRTGYRDITIPQGLLRGFIRKSRQGRDYTAFYKVPYAEPPLNDLRFKDPISPQNGWSGVRAIAEVAPQCIQKEKYANVVQAVGEEDCLYANIYVPDIEITSSSSDLLPVMVYIHGGGFTDGNGSRYAPDYFMDENVIIITFQYRLGPFGFLNTGDDVIRGNMGFKDQVQMLRWTKDNIQYFGGDPQRLAIFGNSAGGSSVSYLMLSHMANGLFHRAITQSGPGVCANSFDPYPNVTIGEVERELGCDAQDSIKFLECLRAKDAKDIALVRTPKSLYGLTIEKREDDQVFMPDTVYNVARDNPNRVPYMLGVVNAEWASGAMRILKTPELVKDLNERWEEVAGKAVLDIVDMSREELLSVKEFYFGEKPIGINQTLRETIALVSDQGMIHCTHTSAKMHGKYGPTYLYYVSKPPYLSYVQKSHPGFPAKEMGLLHHADELQYFWLYDGYPEIKVGDEEYFEFSKFLVKTWVDFARNGEPQQEWKQATGEGEEMFWFELNDKPGKTDAVIDRMKFWDGFTHKQLGYET